jgi:two-component system chemotaxis response regulator CheB
VSVRLAIVDDAHFVRAGLTRLLVGHERIEVVGAAQTGEELLDNFDKWNPDVITLDLNMPGIGGLGTLDRLRDYRAVPVIILSTHSGEGAPLTIEALGRGAVDFIDKEAYSLVDFGSLRSVLVDKILHVVDGSAEPEAPVDATGHTDPMTRTRTETGPYEMMAIGASTGGPRAIELLLSSLGAGFAVPIVIAQHMPAGFTKAFAERLDRSLPLRVREAVHGDLLEPGTVLIAPGGYQLHVIPSGKRQVAVTPADPTETFSPSVDQLFSSATAIGDRVVAVLLTGMGTDGAVGMANLARTGAYTIAQDEHTSVVYGMPRAAAATGAVHAVLPVDEIGSHVRALLA